MGATAAAVAEYFAGSSAAAAGTAAATETAVGSVAAEAATAGVASAATGGGLIGAAGTAAASAAASAAVGGLLAPKRPDLPKPLAMPDPVAQEQARKQSIIEQTARRGRASTILTDAGGGKLGG